MFQKALLHLKHQDRKEAILTAGEIPETETTIAETETGIPGTKIPGLITDLQAMQIKMQEQTVDLLQEAAISLRTGKTDQRKYFPRKKDREVPPQVLISMGARIIKRRS